MRTLTLALLLIASNARADWAQLVDAYYAELPKSHPTAATELGLHVADDQIEDFSMAAIKKEIVRLEGWRNKFATVDGSKLSKPDAADLEIVKLGIESQLVELAQVRSWQHRPDVYSGLASNTVYAIMKRDFAPLAERAKLAVARMKKVPAMLAEGKKNLAEVPAVYVETALMTLPDIISFFKSDVPLAFGNTAEVKQASGEVCKALGDYGEWLKTTLKPRANAPFALGEARFRAKLHADEMIDTPLDQLLARGEAELKRLQGEFKAVAAKIDAKKTPAEVQADMSKDHTTPEKLIPDTQARLAGLRKFLVEKQIVSLPSELLPKVQETPPFMRATTFASMDTPGPFEPKAKEAYYNVTLPEKSWPAAQVEDFLRGAFNRPLIDVVSIHEAFPGHYVQFIWLPLVKSKVRKFESINSNAEGWAHYCEQMLLDEGYGGGDPRLRLAQLQDALLRAARYVVGIRMHTRGMTFAEGVEFFHKEGFQAQKVSEVETRRGTEDPTYLYYTLGKLEVLELREAYKRKLGAQYSLKKFHDAFLAQGAAPLPLVRKALLE